MPQAIRIQVLTLSLLVLTLFILGCGEPAAGELKTHTPANPKSSTTSQPQISIATSTKTNVLKPSPASIATEDAQPKQEELLAFYSDRHDRFVVPIPKDWTAWTFDGYSLLLDPDKLVAVYMMVTEDDNVTSAIETAWSIIDPGFDLKPSVIAPQVPEDGIQDSLVVTYDTKGAPRFEQAYSRLHAGKAYTMIFSADLGAYRNRALDIYLIANGYTINAAP